MSTEARLWTLSTLRSARADADGRYVADPANPVAFTIPSFQRSLVWPERKQRDLIASILKGFPFGALLLVEHDTKKVVHLPNGEQREVANYGIIDGLQRTNAIVSHLREALAFATDEAVKGPVFDEFHASLEQVLDADLEADAVMDAVIGWMADTKEPDVTLGFEFDSMLEQVLARLDLTMSDEQRKDLKVSANALIAHIASRVNIGAKQIPVLIYSGPSEHLPDIFEKINTAGSVLSKYEIFAASWTDTGVRVANKAVRDAIERRYEVLEDEGFDVELVGEDDVYSLFDYLHGLSQVLGEKFPTLFSTEQAQKGGLSGAFPLASVLLGRSLDQMGRLDELFPKDVRNPEHLMVDPFESAVFTAAQLVDEILSPFLAFKFQNERDTPPHGELQIVSMIAAVSAHLFDPAAGFAQRGSDKARKAVRKQLEKALPQHYIYDLIRQYWRGSLYTYAAERVWRGATPSPIYITPVDLQSFDSALNTLFTEQMSKASHKRNNITSFDRAFLKFVYSPRVTVKDQATFKFDVEHWIPVKRVQDMTFGAEPWPMGALGNLGVLPRGLNRIKREETVAEYVHRKRRPPTKDQVELIERMLFMPPHAVAVPKDADGHDAMSADEFIRFVTMNWELMTAQLRKTLLLQSPGPSTTG